VGTPTSTGVARTFYASAAWNRCRDAFYNSKYGLCEDCGAPGEIVHHKDPITHSDIKSNPAKCYGWDNLKLVCRVCHELHHSQYRGGLWFDANGDLIPPEEG